MISVKYQSTEVDQSESGITNSIIYQGSPEEIENLFDEYLVGERYEKGRLKSKNRKQSSPAIWELQLSFINSSSSEAATPPSEVYGKKSAVLRGTRLSMPLEHHKSYRMNWNHYLVAAPGINTVYSQWATAKNALMSEQDAEKYLWIKNLSEMPSTNGKKWHVLKEPIKKGYDYYDVSTYVVTEVAKYGSASRAGRMVQGKLNKIGKPVETFGHNDGNWKCDDADVSWNGSDWAAKLSWTKSGDSRGWDTEIYEKA